MVAKGVEGEEGRERRDVYAQGDSVDVMCEVGRKRSEVGREASVGERLARESVGKVRGRTKMTSISPSTSSPLPSPFLSPSSHQDPPRPPPSPTPSPHQTPPSPCPPSPHVPPHSPSPAKQTSHPPPHVKHSHHPSHSSHFDNSLVQEQD